MVLLVISFLLSLLKESTNSRLRANLNLLPDSSAGSPSTLRRNETRRPRKQEIRLRSVIPVDHRQLNNWEILTGTDAVYRATNADTNRRLRLWLCRKHNVRCGKYVLILFTRL